MPISTNSDAWKQGEEPDRLHEAILDFLRENQDSAFHEREIADEVLGTDWEASHEDERLSQELTEEEYNQRLHNDDLPTSHLAIAENPIITQRLIPALQKLLDEQKIEQRIVDADGFGFPYDWDTVTAFSYSG